MKTFHLFHMLVIHHRFFKTSLLSFLNLWILINKYISLWSFMLMYFALSFIIICLKELTFMCPTATLEQRIPEEEWKVGYDVISTYTCASLSSALYVCTLSLLERKGRSLRRKIYVFCRGLCLISGRISHSVKNLPRWNILRYSLFFALYIHVAITNTSHIIPPLWWNFTVRGTQS